MPIPVPGPQRPGRPEPPIEVPWPGDLLAAELERLVDGLEDFSEWAADALDDLFDHPDGPSPYDEDRTDCLPNWPWLEYRADTIWDANSDPVAKRFRNVAILRAEVVDGVCADLVASSGSTRLEREQRLVLLPHEEEVVWYRSGVHSEEKVLTEAEERGWDPVAVSSKIPFCGGCVAELLSGGWSDEIPWQVSPRSAVWP